MNLLLVLMILLPALGAVLVALVGSNRPAAVRMLALLVTLATLALSLVVAANYETTSPAALEGKVMAPQMVTHATWFVFERDAGPPVKIEAFLGIDGISVLLVVLTALLCVSAVLVSWTAIDQRVAEFFAWLLVLETGMLGVFCAFDIILFYVFFEFTLIPLFFIIGIWGGAQREYAAGKFFIYTLTGSLVSLLGLLAVVLGVNSVNPDVLTFSIPDLAQEIQRQLASGDADVLAFWHRAQFWMFLAMFAGFAVKVPVFPFHTWLPLAHVEAPTAGSVLLAGVLLKLGTYGFLRLAMPLLPLAVADIGVTLVAPLAVIGILYGAFCALSQRDMKRLVAYSSVSHLGFCMLGLFALNSEGIVGGTLQMINHGLSTGALFLLVGMIYERLHTRQLDEMGGLGTRMPLFACALVFSCLSSMGLPGLNGFVGEILCLIGMFKVHPWYTVFATAGIILGAWYLLKMVRLALFGIQSKKLAALTNLTDLNGREVASLAPILVLCLVLGVYPQPFIEVMKPEVDAIAALYADDLPDPLAATAPSPHERVVAVLSAPAEETAQ